MANRVVRTQSVIGITEEQANKLKALQAKWQLEDYLVTLDRLLEIGESFEWKSDVPPENKHD